VPGISKSRLVWELLQLVETEPQLTTWRRGRCLPYGEGVALGALTEVVKAQAGILETDPAEQATAKLEHAVAALIDDQAEAARVTTHLTALVGLADEAGPVEDRRADAFAACGTCWRQWPSSARRCSCSRICIGPMGSSWSSWIIWWSGLPTFHCWSW
jgi:predicted ATPase